MNQPSHSGLTFVTFRAAEQPDRLAGWHEAIARGFHQGRSTELSRRYLGQHLLADDVLMRGVYQDAPPLGAGTIPVATYCSYDKTINTGRGRHPVRMISDVTVSPTHRRRGLLRELITADLAEAAERGIPLAALTVSEGTIYGRFGFGLAVLQHSVEVDTGPRFAFRTPTDDGSVVLLEPAEAWPTMAAVFARFHERTRGSVERPHLYETILTGEFDFESGPDQKLRVAVHLDASGAPEGYAAYRPGPSKNKHRVITLIDLVALTPEAHQRLWRLLGDLDLSDSVEWGSAAVDDPLAWSLVDPFAVRVTGQSDALWVRVLDVPVALSARPWGADGSVVIGVDDPLGHADGTFRITTRGGDAEITRTDDPAGLELAADALGALYLGGVGARTLHAAGRISGADDEVATWAAMLDTGPAPYCLTSF